VQALETLDRLLCEQFDFINLSADNQGRMVLSGPGRETGRWLKYTADSLLEVIAKASQAGTTPAGLAVRQEVG
jgi:hypothetical protein